MLSIVSLSASDPHLILSDKEGFVNKKILFTALQEHIEFKGIVIIHGKGVAEIAYCEENVRINIF